jgi:hypothetical protein
MRRFRFFCIAFLLGVFGIFNLGAQTLKGMSLNGSTGLYSIPSGRIAWDRSSNFGLDIGYHAILHDEQTAHVPKLAAGLFKWLEISAAFDIQPQGSYFYDRSADFIGGSKIQFLRNSTALALGGNFQVINIGKDDNLMVGQAYLAATYAGHFFTMPAETTMVLGKTFIENNPYWDIDFGMGFDMILIPQLFGNLTHWILDFANFSYSVRPFSANAWNRGVLNTGLRIDLSSIPALSKFKFVIDVLITDALDETRAFSVGAVFGVPVM